MELKEFVKLALKQIVEAATDTRADIARTGHKIAPAVVISDHFGNTEIIREGLLQYVEFDVAVTVESSKSLEANLKGSASADLLVVAKAETSGEVERVSGEKESRASRVKFSIPISLVGGQPLTLLERPKHPPTSFGPST